MEVKVIGADRAAPAAPARERPRVRWARWRWTAAGGVLLAVALVCWLLVADGPGRVTSAASSFGGAFRELHWGFLPLLGLLSALHYVCAAVALRAAAGRPLPPREATLVQFTAAAANRVTPSGLGAAAVNSRYLVCRGMPAARAVAAVAVLQAVGFPADLLLLLAVLGVGAAFGGGAGFGGGEEMIGTLGAHSSTIADRVPLIPLLALAGLLLVAAAIWGRKALRSAAVTHAVTGLTDLIRRPGDLCLALLASAATTFVLGIALGVSVLAVPGAATPGDLPTLIVAYLIGAAAGAALPAPGGVGSTEATLVVALGAVGVAAGPAVQAVLVFRAITYWAPVPFGLVAARHLRTRDGVSLDDQGVAKVETD